MDQIKPRERVITLLIIFTLLLLSIVSVLFRMLWLIETVVLVQAILFLVFAGITVWTLYRQRLVGIFISRLKENWFVFPFLIFALASIFWSIDKEVSIYRWVIFVSTILIGGYLGIRFSMKELVGIYTAFSLQILFLSIMMILIFPSFGIMHYHSIQGAWSGIFWHKNHMGLFATFINLMVLINLVESIRSKTTAKYLWGALYLFSLFVVYQTDSVAAYFSTIFLHGVYLLLFAWMKIRGSLKPKHYILFVVIVVVGALLIGTNLDILFGLFNRNTTLTGRIPMWTHLFDTYLAKRPYFGYGFNAFWYPYAHRMEIQQVARYPDPVMIADNGFLDILMNTGVVGLGLFLILYLGIWYRALKFFGRGKTTLAVFPVLVMAFTLISNISWSLIFENESFFMLLMVVVMFLGSNPNAEKPVDDPRKDD